MLPKGREVVRRAGERARARWVLENTVLREREMENVGVEDHMPSAQVCVSMDRFLQNMAPIACSCGELGGQTT